MDDQQDLKRSRLRAVVDHLDDHKEAYLAGAGCLALGYVLRGKAPEIKQIIKPKNQIGVGYKCTQIMNAIVLPAKGDPGDVVQNLSTLETYASKGELAKALGIPRSMVTRYFNGQASDILGDQFEVLGKAGHAIPVA